jgi:hypothetical protein
LQFGVINEVVVSKRLLDHCQSKVVQGLKHGSVAKRVSTVAVDMDCRIGETIAYRSNHLELPAWSELQLYSAESLHHRFPNDRQQFFEMIHDSEVGPDVDFAPDATQEFPQRLAKLARVQIPPRQVQGGFSEKIALESSQPGLEFITCLDALAHQLRAQPVPYHEEGSLSPLGTVSGRRPWTGFAPTVVGSTRHLDKETFDSRIITEGSSQWIH